MGILQSTTQPSQLISQPSQLSQHTPESSITHPSPVIPTHVKVLRVFKNTPISHTIDTRPQPQTPQFMEVSVSHHPQIHRHSNKVLKIPHELLNICPDIQSQRIKPPSLPYNEYYMQFSCFGPQSYDHFYMKIREISLVPYYTKSKMSTMNLSQSCQIPIDFEIKDWTLIQKMDKDGFGFVYTTSNTSNMQFLIIR
jgi:hypothetical protein